MILRNLVNNPIWKKSELGSPLPESCHSVSVALPTWEDVINYEEKEENCINSLRTIYPRFGLNPLLKKLIQEIISEDILERYSAWPYPNNYLALKAKKFCDKNTLEKNSFIITEKNLSFLITSKPANDFARIFWQHTGLGLSSREAAIYLKLEHRNPKKLVQESYSTIQKRIANNIQIQEDFIHLTSSGMSALYTALEIIYEIFPQRPILQIGFPYVDVLKLPSKIFYGSKLILEENCEDIESEIKRINPAALVVELPSNPMLKCVNIKKIAEIAKRLNLPVITDDTIGSNINIDSIYHSDLVFTSLTKIFAGTGTILAGSLILNPKSKWIKNFQDAIHKIQIPKLSDNDLIELEISSRDIEERVYQQNNNCLKLKKKLETHKSIKKVFHPENCENFNSIIKYKGGYGCLLSFELNGGIEKTKSFYDSLQISKGPSLGTHFTLVSPYVMLAHYNELNWARSYGIPPHLIRVSVGLEDPEILWKIFSRALND